MVRSLRRQRIKNNIAESEQFRRRSFIGFVCIALAMLGLSFGYFRLQVLQHQEYQLRSDANRIKPRPIVPARGLIYDRNGKLLADNIPAYRVELVPDQIEDIDKTVADIKKIISLSTEDLEAFQQARKATGRFRPVVLKLRLNEEERAKLALNRYRLPNVEVVPYLTRRYPYENMFAHVIGYVGRVDAKDLEKMADSKFSALSHTGKSGLEKFYEKDLRGEIGYESVETNAQGRSLKTIGMQQASPGYDIQLSIDADLQKATIEAFGELQGAAIAVDPRTGEVLAMVSLPLFDPNLFINGISHKNYRALTDNLSRPLYDRNSQGGTAPGSTIKPFVGLAGLESGIRKPEDKILSTGEFFLPGVSRGFRDSHHGGHGWVDLQESIAQSVNTYYYKLAIDLGIQRFDSYMLQYGFGKKTGIDLPSESIGILPSPEWKRKRFNEAWYPGDTVNAGIGQGAWNVTPLQLAQATAALANNGARHKLHLLKAKRKGFQTQWLPEALAPTEKIVNDQAHIDAVKRGMWGAVNGPRGTARAIAVGAPYTIAGKTGTAQRVSRKGNVSLNPNQLAMNQRHQALFIAYAPADNPQIAIAVMVEHGGFGATTAAPIARKMMDAWLLPKTPATTDAPSATPNENPAANATAPTTSAHP
ncbi:MAG: penicillin-binding protein 2 [Arenimonas sp.]